MRSQEVVIGWWLQKDIGHLYRPNRVGEVIVSEMRLL